MGLFGGNHNIYKDTEKGNKQNMTPKAKTCGMCHGNGYKLEKSGRVRTKKRCKSCKGTGMR